jgi:hypothetical protein
MGSARSGRSGTTDENRELRLKPDTTDEDREVRLTPDTTDETREVRPS